MQYLLHKIIFLISLVCLVSSCASISPMPKQYKNICTMLDDNINWYKDLVSIEKLYKVDMSSILAIIKQESSFKAHAAPPRKKLFNTIPLQRISTAYGYAQAKDETWAWYQQQTTNTHHRRDNFAHSAEFIAWYMTQTLRINKVPLTDIYNQYLAYHEGHTGYKNKSYAAKGWLLKVAKKVSTTANNYKTNLAACRAKLDDTHGWSYF